LDKRFPLPRLDRARQKWAVAHESKTVVSHAALPAIPARFSRYQKHHHHPADRSKSNLCVLRRVCGRVTFECSDLCKFPDSSCQVLVRTVSTKYGRRVSHLFRSGLVSATRSRRCSPPPRRRATCGPPGEAYRDRLRRTGRHTAAVPRKRVCGARRRRTSSSCWCCPEKVSPWGRRQAAGSGRVHQAHLNSCLFLLSRSQYRLRM
jgi:hypothetical protein